MLGSWILGKKVPEKFLNLTCKKVWERLSLLAIFHTSLRWLRCALKTKGTFVLLSRIQSRRDTVFLYLVLHINVTKSRRLNGNLKKMNSHNSSVFAIFTVSVWYHRVRVKRKFSFEYSTQNWKASLGIDLASHLSEVSSISPSCHSHCEYLCSVQYYMHNKGSVACYPFRSTSCGTCAYCLWSFLIWVCH